MKFSKNKKLEKYIGEEIIDFLKKKGLYDLYYFNLEQYFNKIIKEYPKKEVSLPFTIGSFIWKDSKEGYAFWYNINETINHLGLTYETKPAYLKNIL